MRDTRKENLGRSTEALLSKDKIIERQESKIKLLEMLKKLDERKEACKKCLI